MPQGAVTEAATATIERAEQKAREGVALAANEALALLALDDIHIYELIAAADRVRRQYKGTEISLCSIINARSGTCPEDCGFCSQSVHATSDSPEFNLVPAEKIIEGAKSAIESGAHKFGVVTSGYGFAGDTDKKDFSAILDSIKKMKEEVGIHRCASLGVIGDAEANALREAGVLEYHHNLETARSFFPEVCTTHDYDDDVNTARAVKRAGLKLCCGGIFGLGESNEQRVELAMTLKELDVDSVPINFLNPIKGTRLGNRPPMPPMECLKLIAMFRMVMPDKDLKVAGGRETCLRDLQGLMFAAGANSTMVGNYLTTLGRSPEQDRQMITDLGLFVREA